MEYKHKLLDTLLATRSTYSFGDGDTFAALGGHIVFQKTCIPSLTSQQVTEFLLAAGECSTFGCLGRSGASKGTAGLGRHNVESAALQAVAERGSHGCPARTFFGVLEALETHGILCSRHQSPYAAVYVLMTEGSEYSIGSEGGGVVGGGGGQELHVHGSAGNGRLATGEGRSTFRRDLIHELHTLTLGLRLGHGPCGGLSLRLAPGGQVWVYPMDSSAFWVMDLRGTGSVKLVDAK